MSKDIRRGTAGLPDPLFVARALEPVYPGAVFARGYLFSEREPVYVPPSWSVTTALGATLYRDPRLGMTHASSGSAEVMCVGTIVDTRDPGLSDAEVVARLLEGLDRSVRELGRQLSWTNGRYVVFYRRRSRTVRVLSDATAMRSVFYADHPGTAVASHAALMAINCGAAVESNPIPHKWGFPGRLTPYRRVFMLTPNTRLKLPEKAVERFFPTRAGPTRSVSSVVGACAEILRRSAEAFAARLPLIASLTAGRDSRLTLAALRGVSRETRFFTYYRSDLHSTDLGDLVGAAAIAKAHQLDHRIVNLAGVVAEPNFETLCSLNTHYGHITALARHLYSQHHDACVLHVRSNLGEIGRAFYGKWVDAVPTSEVTAAILVKCYVGRFQQNALAEGALNDQLTGAFDDFMEVAHFRRGARFVDFRDLLYWEHRMGCWHAQVVAETDPAFETVSLFNCRRLLELLLAPSYGARRSGELFHAVIGRLWPELNAFPVNPTVHEAAVHEEKAALLGTSGPR